MACICFGTKKIRKSIIGHVEPLTPILFYISPIVKIYFYERLNRIREDNSCIVKKKKIDRYFLLQFWVLKSYNGNFSEKYIKIWPENVRIPPHKLDNLIIFHFTTSKQSQRHNWYIFMKSPTENFTPILLTLFFGNNVRKVDTNFITIVLNQH